MAVIVVNANDFVGRAKELIKTRSGNGWTSSGARTYERVWLVRIQPGIATTKEIGASMALRCPGIPLPYSSYLSDDGTEFDDLAVLVDYQTERQDELKFENWIVRATYSTEVPEGGIPAIVSFGHDMIGAQNQPWLERPKVEWDWEETTYYPSRDLKGKPYTNSALMPFTPAPGFPAARSVLVVTRNEPRWSRALAASYCFGVNSDVFCGAPVGTVLSMPPRVRQRSRGTLQFYEVTYRLKFNLPKRYSQSGGGAARLEGDPNPNDLQTWQPQILDQGTHQLPVVDGVPFAGRPIPIIRYGLPTTRDVLLDGAGREQVKDAGTGLITPRFIDFVEFHSVELRPIIENGLGGTGAEPIEPIV